LNKAGRKRILLTFFVIVFALSSASFLRPARADDTTTTIYPSPQTPTINSTLSFKLDIKIKNIYQMTAYQVYVNWDPRLLSLTDITPGSFLSNNGQYSTIIQDQENDTLGTYGYIEAQYPAQYQTAVGTGTGNATLLTLTFTAKGTGQCLLHISGTNVKLLTQSLTHVVEDGYFNNQQLTYPYAGVNYNVTIASNSTAHDLSFDATAKTFTFNGSVPTGTTDYANITIPKPLLNVDPSKPPGAWVVMLDDVPTTSFTATSNRTCTFIYLTLTSGDRNIVIEGNEALTPVDETPPITTLTVGDPKYTNSSGNVYVTMNTPFALSAEDNVGGSGVAATAYRISNATYDSGWTNYVAAEFHLTGLADGEYPIDYNSTDNAGNLEPTNVSIVFVDNTPPTTTLTIGEPKQVQDQTRVTSDTPFTLAATDAGSGVKSTVYEILNSSGYDTGQLTYNGPFNLTSLSPGRYAIKYRSTDNVGNNETEHTQEVVLYKPVTSISITINDGAAYTNSATVTLSLNVPDMTDVQKVRYSNDGMWNTVQWENPTFTRTWELTSGEGNKTVYCQVMDMTGSTLNVNASIVLDTTNPVANAGANQTVDQGAHVTFDGSASTDENGIVSFTWTFMDVTPQTLTGQSPTYTFNNPGVYVVTLNVTDPADNYQTGNVTITVCDITKPIAVAGLNLTINEGTTVTLNGSASSDNVGIVSFTWTFMDVTPQTLTGQSPTYTFNNPGVYVVTLNVTDAAGNWATATTTVTVLDTVKPVANAGQDQTVNVGSTVTFNASASSDNVGIVSYEWGFGDGTNGTGVTTSHTYADAGTYNVTLTVRDAANNTGTAQIKVTVESEQTMPVTEIAVAAIIITAVAITTLALWRKRRHTKQ
jgi:PKD repeat protein